MRFGCVFRDIDEGLAVTMLLDAEKRQFYGATGWIQIGSGEYEELGVFGGTNSSQILLGSEVVDAAQRIRIQVRGPRPGKLNNSIGSQSDRTVRRSSVVSSRVGLWASTRDEEPPILSERVKLNEIRVTAAKQAENLRVRQNVIDSVDFVDRTAGRINTGGNATTAIERGVHLDRAIAATRLRSSDRRRAQIRRCGVLRLDKLVQLRRELFGAIQIPNLGDDFPRKNGRDTGVARFVDVRRRIVRETPTKTVVPSLELLRTRNRFDFARASAPGEVCENHRHFGTLRGRPGSGLCALGPSAPVRRWPGSAKRGGAARISTGGCGGSVSGSTHGSLRVRRISATDKAGSRREP
jgi:hypothetical protein